MRTARVGGALLVAVVAAALLWVRAGSAERRDAGAPSTPIHGPAGTSLSADPSPGRPTAESVPRGDDSRSPTTSRALAADPAVDATFLVSDDGGEPLEDVAVGVVAWERALWAHGVEAGHPEAERVRSATGWCRTDAFGAADFALGTVPSTPHGAVVWAVRAGYRLEQRLFDSLEGVTTPIRFQLVPVAAPRAEVVDGAGRPVPGARVELRLPLAPPLPFEAVTPAQHSCSTLLLDLEADDLGRVSLPGPPLESVADQVLVRALDGARLSPWRAVSPGEQVRLELVDGFELSGRVEGFDAFVQDGADLAQVLVERLDDGRWVPFAGLPIELDGTFGPRRLAGVAGEVHRARLDGHVGVPAPVSFTPTAGAVTEVILVARRTTPVWVVVVAAEDGRGIGAATAVARWESEEGPVALRALLDRVDEPGSFRFTGVPDDRPFWIEASAPGRATVRVGTLRLPAAAAEMHMAYLPRAAALGGEIADRGAGSATLYLLPEGADAELTVERATLDADGGFALEAAPAGDLWLVAVTNDGRWSAPSFVPATGRQGLRVEPIDRAIRAEVVDARTGVPVADAELRLWLGNDAGRRVELGLAARSDAEGRLTLPGVVDAAPLGLGATLSCAGYESRDDLVGAARTDGEQLALEPLEPLTVFLRHAGGAVPQGLGLDLYGPTPIPFEPLDPDGRLDLSGRAPGFYGLRLAYTAERYGWLWFGLPGRLEDQQALVLDGPAALVVELIGRTPGRRLAVRVRGAADEDGVARGREQVVGPDATTTAFEGLPLGAARVTVEDATTLDVLAEAEVELVGGGAAVGLAIDLAPTGWRFEVVDREGRAVEGARVSVIDEQGPRVVGDGTTGADGWVDLAVAASVERATAAVVAAGRGALLDRALAAPGPLDASAPATRLVLEDGARLTLSVTSGGAPLAGATVLLTDRSERLRLAPEGRTDEGGRARFEGLPAGSATVFVRAAGHLPEWRSLELTAGAEAGVELLPTAALRLRVLDAAGAPVEGAAVALRRVGLDEPPLGTWPEQGLTSRPAGFRTGADGVLELGGVPLAALDVEVSAGGRSAALRLAADRGVEVTVLLGPAGEQGATDDPR